MTLSLRIPAGARAASPGGDLVGALVLHGFTGSPETMAPVADALAASGVVVELPLLPGHGASEEALAETTYADWRRSAAAALSSLAARVDRVVIVGLSMGGTLALDLAAGDDGLAGVVLINPLAEPPAASLLELLERAGDAGVESVAFGGADLADPSSGYVGATTAPLGALRSLLEALGPLADRLGSVTAPVLLCTSAVDHVVPTSTGDYLCARLGGEVRRLVLEHSFHLATLDADGPLVAEECARFVRARTARR